MIYFLYGTDTYKSRKKLHEFLDVAAKKRPDAEVFKLDSENWSEAQFQEFLVAKGLFSQKYTVVLDNLLDKKEIKEVLLEKFKEMSESEHIFFWIEAKADAAVLKKIEKHAKQVQKFDSQQKKKEANIFSITDGLLAKDKKKLWISFIDFLSVGTPVEEIHGIFFWQVKNMILVSREKSQSNTGLAPFSYSNALRGSKKYTSEELQKMSSELVGMTHKVRSGEGDLDIMLEKWILSEI